TNPANLEALSQGTVVIEFIPLGVSAGSDFMNLQLYNDYFTGTGQVDSAGNKVGTSLSQSDKQKILDAFPDGVGNVRTDVNFRDFGVSIRNLVFALGFSVDDKVGTQVAIPNTFASFALNGLNWGSNYSWNALALKSFWYRTYNADYAMRLPDVFPIPKEIAKNFEVGIGIKYVTGFSYTSMQSTNTSIYADSVSHSYVVNMGFNAARAGLLSQVISKAVKSNVGDTVVQFNPFAPQGTGLGLDLGVTGIVMNFIKVGISFTDIGSISWSKNVVYTRGDTTINYAGFSPAQTNVPGSQSNLDSIKNSFNDYFKNKDTVGSSFSTALPTKMNIGASVQLNDLFPTIPGELLVAMDYHQGFNNSLNNSTNPEFIFGAEWKPAQIIPLRTAFGFGGEYGFRWSAGFGINLPSWDFDIGLGTFNAIVAPMSAKNVSFTFSILKFRF
ncbi:MAG: DUF5723 family protein, partial [Candidatus Kryptoniota bacterium]